MNQEAIELLEKARKWILEEGGVVCPHKFGTCKHDNDNCPVFCVDQALTLLKQQPAAGDFTKECRELLRKGVVDEQWEIATLLRKACDRLDRAESTNKDLLAACKFAKAQIKKGAQKKALPVLRAVLAKAKKEGETKND